jgi:hypothetical protein
MNKTDEARAREQRLAAKLRDNLRRRKEQARARAGQDAGDPTEAKNSPAQSEERPALRGPADSDS